MSGKELVVFEVVLGLGCLLYGFLNFSSSQRPYGLVAGGIGFCICIALAIYAYRKKP